jgi:hypothetical protein
MPQYPLLTPNVKPLGYYPKASIPDLMKVYRELSGLGLYVVPKQKDKKLPVNRYWQKNNRVHCTESMAYADQQSEGVSGWCVVTGSLSGNLVVLDFDTKEIEINGVDPVRMYDYVQDLSPTDFVLASPAGGVHLYYRLPDTMKMLGNSKPLKGIDVRGEGGQVVTLLGYNRYDNTPDDNIADKKGVPDGHVDTYRKLTDGRYNEIPEMTQALYDWLVRDKVTKDKPHPDTIGGKNYAQTAQGQERLEKHFKQHKTDRERIVLECLSYVLDDWNSDNGYEQWYQLWMSSHHGSDGSTIVRDLLLTHPNIYWRDGAKGRAHFKQAWDGHVYREEQGYTVASLFWLARKSGWLAQTGYEIPDALVEKFNEQYVTNWLIKLEDLPARALIQSQTGSGKTRAIKYVWERLGMPKGVIFVPSVKLATELCNTLIKDGVPATLYIDNDTQRALPTETLIKASLLVTTLQTFATKVFNAGVPMSDYGFVYIEECDQLFIQFARGDGGKFGSHVTGNEARLGYAVLRDAFANSGLVWGVDATMSRVSYDLAEALKANYTIQVYRNEYISKKAPVTFLDSKGEAYQEVLRALMGGKQVVVAADTAQVADEVVSIMVQIGVVTEDETISITRPSERSKKVRAFMEDVNEEAKKYRLISYNSCMASGVSITEVTPDVVVQICTYLTPRNNLQLLNRFRKQKIVYCYYRMGESLYAKSAQEILDDAERRAWIESAQVKIPVAIRNDDAKLREYITSLSIGDEYQQNRSAREFYKSLIQGDGRKVTTGDEVSVSHMITASLEAVKQARKEYAEELKTSWVETPPIDRKRPALPSYTPIQVAQGEIHAQIERALRGNLPLDTDPKEVYDTVYEFVDVVAPLTAFLEQGEALRRAENYLADSGKAITALTNNITLVRVLATLHHMYRSLDDVLTNELVAERAKPFMAALWDCKEAYEAVTSRDEQSWDAVYNRNDTDEERALDFAKILLSRIGLDQRQKRKGRDGKLHFIKNAEAARKFISWRMPDKTDIVFSDAPIEKIINDRAQPLLIYDAMSATDKERVMNMVRNEKYTTFEMAVMTIYNNEDGF